VLRRRCINKVGKQATQRNVWTGQPHARDTRAAQKKQNIWYLRVDPKLICPRPDRQAIDSWARYLGLGTQA